MNKETTIVETALENLQHNLGLLAEYESGGTNQLDGKLTIRNFHHKTLTFYFEVKYELRQNQLPAIEDLAKENQNLMVIAYRIFPEVKKKLHEQGIAYLEANGNIFIHSKKIYYLVDNQKALPKINKPNNRAFTKTGLRVVFQLLLDQDFMKFTYREMAAQLGIGLGNFNYIFNGLRKASFMLEADKNVYLLQNKKELFYRWITEYKDKLQPALLIGRFRFLNEKDFLNWKNLPLDHQKTHWGGEPAADLLTGNLQPAILTLYTTKTRMEMIKNYRLVPDEEGNVLIFQKFWRDTMENQNIVPPLLVYVDLTLNHDSRLIETAQMIYDEYIQDNL